MPELSTTVSPRFTAAIMFAVLLLPLLLRAEDHEVEQDDQRQRQRERPEHVGEDPPAPGVWARAGVAKNMTSPNEAGRHGGREVGRKLGTGPAICNAASAPGPGVCKAARRRMGREAMEPLALAPSTCCRRSPRRLERLSPAVPPEPDFAAAGFSTTSPRRAGSRPRPTIGCRPTCWSGSSPEGPLRRRTCSASPQGLPANHALLWGVRGTGKSSLVKAAFMERPPSGRPCALVEVDRDAVSALPALFNRLRDRPERFVVLCDDLSFEEGAAARQVAEVGAGGRGVPARRTTCCSSPPPTAAT